LRIGIHLGEQYFLETEIGGISTVIVFFVLDALLKGCAEP